MIMVKLHGSVVLLVVFLLVMLMLIGIIVSLVRRVLLLLRLYLSLLFFRMIFLLLALTRFPAILEIIFLFSSWKKSENKKQQLKSGKSQGI